MTRIMIHGFLGAMGQKVNQQLQEYQDIEIIPFDYMSTIETVHSDYNKVKDIDVIIDFSHYSLTDHLLDFALKYKIPTVICTTSLEEATQSRIQQYKSEFPIFQSGNMSIGINLLIELAKLGAQTLPNFDIEIIEKHHNQKIDAPSGTALMIADAIKGVQEQLSYTYGRSGNNTKRQSNELGIHAIRGGTITGEHTLLFAGLDETIEIKHQATSKVVFAKGAIDAAFFIMRQEVGLYNMSNLILGGSNEY